MFKVADTYLWPPWSAGLSFAINLLTLPRQVSCLKRETGWGCQRTWDVLVMVWFFILIYEKLSPNEHFSRTWVPKELVCPKRNFPRHKDKRTHSHCTQWVPFSSAKRQKDTQGTSVFLGQKPKGHFSDILSSGRGKFLLETQMEWALFAIIVSTRGKNIKSYVVSFSYIRPEWKSWTSYDHMEWWPYGPQTYMTVWNLAPLTWASDFKLDLGGPFQPH